MHPRGFSNGLLGGLILWAIIIFLILSLSGCQTASKISDKRDEAATIETDLHINGMCSSNFDVLYAKFGTSDQLWSSFLTICGHQGGSTLREPQ